MFQWRDEEDPESRARRLAHDRDHHAQVIKTGSEFFCLSFVRKLIVHAQWWSWRHESFGQSCLCRQGLSFTGSRWRGGRSETCSPCWPDGAPSSGPSFLFVFCKKIDRPCTMMVILTTQELILPKREIKDDVSVEGWWRSRVKGWAAGKRSRPTCAGDQKSVKDDDLADDNLYIIGRFCLSVCHEKWSLCPTDLLEPSGTF